MISKVPQTRALLILNWKTGKGFIKTEQNLKNSKQHLTGMFPITKASHVQYSIENMFEYIESEQYLKIQKSTKYKITLNLTFIPPTKVYKIKSLSPFFPASNLSFQRVNSVGHML